MDYREVGFVKQKFHLTDQYAYVFLIHAFICKGTECTINSHHLAEDVAKSLNTLPSCEPWKYICLQKSNLHHLAEVQRKIKEQPIKKNCNNTTG